MKYGQTISIRALLWLPIQAAVIATALCTVAAQLGQWYWLADLFSHFRFHYAVVQAIGVVLFVLGRKWSWGGGAALALALNVAVILPHGPALLVPAPSQGNALKIRCISVNLQQENTRYSEVESFVAKSEADVVIFQEVTPEWADMIRKFAPIYPAQWIRTRQDYKGAALISKYHAADLRFEEMPGIREDGLIIGNLDTPSGRCIFLGAHAPKPRSIGPSTGSDHRPLILDLTLD